jgi:hypothetical protein
MRTPIAIAFAAAAAGCSTPPPAVDSTPENPTAVFETRMASNGIAGMFPFETTEKHYVRADMRRDERDTKGTGRFSGFLVTRLMGGPGDTMIARLDRKLLWTVNDRRKEYSECPVQGCPVPAGVEDKDKGKPEAQREEPKQQTEEGCVTRIASSRFDVKPTGQKREVNGFNAEQYDGAWVVRMQDNQKRTTTSTVKFDVWTTPVNAQMRQAMETEAAFGRAYLASAKAATPALKPGEHPVMPPEMMSMMTGYLGSLSPNDRANFTRAVRELEKIKGHPVSTKIDWLLEGNACGAKDEQQAPPQQSGMGGLLSGAMGMLGQKKEEPTGPTPLLSFTFEVKQLGVQPVRDSRFQVPPTYKRVN